MRLSASEILNGAIFAALVVLASEVQRADAPAPPADPSRHSGAASASASSQIDAEPTERDGFAVRPEPGASSGASAGADAGTRTHPASEEARSPGQPLRATEPALPKAASLNESAGALRAEQTVDAFVPPIKRQRPVTPPLVFKAPSEKSTERAARKITKAKAKRAARKGQDAARSSLGAGAKAKP